MLDQLKETNKHELKSQLVDTSVSPSSSPSIIPGKNDFLLTHSVDLMQIKVTINGKLYDALIDTGSSKSLVTEEVVTELNCKVECCPITIGVVGENSIKPSGKCELNICIGGTPMKAQDYVILPSYKSITSLLILGQDFFKNNRFEVDVSKSKLISRHPDSSFIEFIFHDTGALLSKTARVCCYASHDTIVPQEKSSLVHIDRLPIEGNDFDQIEEFRGT